MAIVCMGELLIDFVALETGVTVGEASGFQKAPGGAPANVAVAVRRLGGESAFVGQVGNDPFGQHLHAVLAAEGVDVRGLRLTDAARTMLAFVSLAADGERSFVFYRHPSADMLMTADDVDLDVVDQAEIFHFGSITLISEPARTATLFATQRARSKGALISYDPNLRLSLWESADAARVGMLTGLNYAHIIKVSEEELEFLTGGHDPAALWQNDLQLIVVTRGAKGASVYTRKEAFHIAGQKVQAVDTTGAGDAFVGGLLVGIAEHGDEYRAHLKRILCFANAAGALTTTHRGAIPALPLRKSVEAFMQCPD